MYEGASHTVVVGQVDTVDDQPVVAREFGEASGRVDVVGTLGDVDVEPDPEVGCESGGGSVFADKRGSDIRAVTSVRAGSPSSARRKFFTLEKRSAHDLESAVSTVE